MSVQPSAIDPPEIAGTLWEGLSGAIAFDIGANCGQSLSPLRMACPVVHAFEPGEEAYAYLAEHYAGFDGIHLHQLAVTGTDGDIELAEIPEQLLTGQLVTPGTPGMEWSVADWSQVARRKVPGKRVDTLAKELGWPELIKVDTEGHEAQVLCGATEVLAKRRTQWLIEFHSPVLQRQCWEMLLDAGYRVQLIRHPHYKAGSPMWDQHGWIKTIGLQ